MSIKGFYINGSLEKYDYNALENAPAGGIPEEVIEQIESDVKDAVLAELTDAETEAL